MLMQFKANYKVCISYGWHGLISYQVAKGLKIYRLIDFQISTAIKLLICILTLRMSAAL